MTVAMLGKFYQYKDNKGTIGHCMETCKLLLSLREGAFQCLLSIALVIKQWLTDDVHWQNLGLEAFLWAFSKHAEEK